LHELEASWWILASIDLTRLPSSRSSTQKDPSADEPFEYSSREVAPPQLLLRQLLRAHSIFLLHHGTSLRDLYKKSSRDAFCDSLDRFWSRYIRNWDVLLHGNPAVDIYNGIKLAVGGEIGIGVGEEDWGSGEREVLEDFVSRTEGLIDLIVSRFGDAPVEQAKDGQAGNSKPSQVQQDPWLGTDSDPRSSDGVLFSGVGALSRRSLATLSQWMEWIYKYGEGAYGVGENPSSRHRRRKKRPPAGGTRIENGSRSHTKHIPKETVPPPVMEPHDLRREAMERSAAGPNIPPPIVGAAEKSLEKATPKAKKREASPMPADKEDEDAATSEDSGLFAADKMMKILSMGYGTSWTLSLKGLPGNTSAKNPLSTPTLPDQKGGVDAQQMPAKDDEDASEEIQLQEVDPTPEISDHEDVPFVQRLEQSIGKFIIGLSGDLENTEMIDDEPKEAGDVFTSQAPQRVFLRTLTVGVADIPGHLKSPSQEEDVSSALASSAHSANNKSCVNGSASSTSKYGKFQVAVYVHQPFIFAFLFTLRTPMLTFPSFYRNIHHQLGPLQRPLLRSTDPMKVAQRIADAVGERSSTTIPAKREAPTDSLVEAQTIYDVIFDPNKLTVRTSIPNIPMPGTFAAEGLSSFSRSSVTVSGSWYTLGIPISTAPSTSQHQTGSGMEKSPWTRVEALNVHTQILNTWSATHDGRSGDGREEWERTVKTGRGWWILWMRVPSTSNYGIDGDKEAFLVRKATDHAASAKRRDASSASSGSRWLLRDQTRDISGSSTGSRAGVTAMAGISEGVGVDARKWVDGLLSLNR
jgi:hypothetical protein